MSELDFWRGRRVFLTGHTGFKGGWLALWLSSLGAKVTGYALPPPTDPSLFELTRLHELVDHEVGDIRDPQPLTAAMRRAAPEVVIHMAAQPIVRASYDAPADTFATNVLGTAHVLDAVRASPGVRAVVVVTSDKCYENREWHWGYREDEAMGGADPYSASKGCTELVAASYRRSFFPADRYDQHGVALATVRAGNVVGGGDWAADRLVPDAMQAFSRGETLTLRYPGAVRPWQHVLEPLAGYLAVARRLAAEGPAWGEGWNFGPGEEGERTVAAVVERLAALWGDGARWAVTGEPQPHEARFLKLDCSKARARLGWRPRLDFAATLALAVDWRRAYVEGGDMRATTLAQIAGYAQMLDAV